MKRTGFFLIVVLSVSKVAGQNDPYFSHYMFNPAYYNPGWLGDVTVATAAFHHRSQWVGYETTFDGNGGAPTTQLMSLVVPVDGKLSSGGLNIMHDRLGVESTFKLQVGAAYNRNFKGGVVSFGLMPAVISRTIGYDQLRFVDPGDQLNGGQSETQLAPDLATGVFVKTFSGYFGGVGVDHLLSPSLIRFDGVEQTRGKLIPTYYFHGGKTMTLNRDLELTPTALIKTDFKGLTLDVSGVMNYRDTMWGGVSYRRSESLVFLVGSSFLENKVLKVGYSFDYVLENQEAKRPTSHEIFIKYDLPSMVLGGRKAVKTPRFSF